MCNACESVEVDAPDGELSRSKFWRRRVVCVVQMVVCSWWVMITLANYPWEMFNVAPDKGNFKTSSSADTSGRRARSTVESICNFE